MTVSAAAHRPSHHAFVPSADPRAGGSIATFAAIAVPSGWVFLGVPVALGWPVEPFVLLTLVVGLVLPAVLLTPRGARKQLLREALRVPARLRWLVVGLVVVPALTWVAAAALGSAERFSTDVMVEVGVNLLTGLLIVNVWEEMAWTGFLQRRTMARWGRVRGSLVAALLFAGIHLPLAFDGADGPGAVLVGVGVLIGSAVGLRLLIAGLDLWSGGALLAVATLHASFNASALVVEPDSDWVRYVVVALLGLAAAAALVVTAPGGRTRAGTGRTR